MNNSEKDKFSQSKIDTNTPTLESIETKLPQPVQYNPEKCIHNIGKGQRRIPNEGEVILDTGDYEITGKGDPYEESISAGVIDHHRIDNLKRVSGQDFQPKCSTKIITDYAEAVKKMIQDKNVTTTFSHMDGDLDSIVSSYLTQGLIQRKELSAGAIALSEHVNKVDYGMYREANIEKYFQSLLGIFSAFKAELEKRRDDELTQNVFKNPEMKAPNGRLNNAGVQKLNEIKNKYSDLLNDKMFQLLNGMEREAINNSQFDPEKQMSLVIDKLSPEIQEIIEKGKEIVKNELETFNEDFEKAEKINIKINVPKTGETLTVPMIISKEPQSAPLTFTNLAYQRISPDTIVGVYGGPNRKNGDMYDIGIMPESAQLIDMGKLCVELNRAEKEKRDQLPPDDETRKYFETQPDRLNMSGPEQILTKDPTVLVAGGTLIAATRKSLLTAEDFNRVIKNFEVKPEV